MSSINSRRSDGGVTPQGSGDSRQQADQANWEDAVEVFCGSVPKGMVQDELMDLFAEFGPLLDFRLIKEPCTSQNKGYAFMTFQRKEDAKRAIAMLDGAQVRRRQYLKVSRALPNSRLFVANIPKAKGRDELFTEFSARTAGLKDVIIYSSPDDTRRNRGFCFLDYETHRDAAIAKRRLSSPGIRVFGCDIAVDWADPEQVVDQEIMDKVRILYAKNISAMVNEEELRGVFGRFGFLEKVKKIKDFAFIHFATRNDAAWAKEQMHGKPIRGVPVELYWAKPPTDKEKRQQTLRAREKRALLQQSLTPVRGSVNPNPMPSPRSTDEWELFPELGRGDQRERRMGHPQNGEFTFPSHCLCPGQIPYVEVMHQVDPFFFFMGQQRSDYEMDVYNGQPMPSTSHNGGRGGVYHNRPNSGEQGYGHSHADSDNNWRANARPSPPTKRPEWRHHQQPENNYWLQGINHNQRCNH